MCAFSQTAFSPKKEARSGKRAIEREKRRGGEREREAKQLFFFWDFLRKKIVGESCAPV
jgi:hypothetical protein